jgi:hypothetical protein
MRGNDMLITLLATLQRLHASWAARGTPPDPVQTDWGLTILSYDDVY